MDKPKMQSVNKADENVAKMGKGVLLKICTALDCGIDDIVEVIPNK